MHRPSWRRFLSLPIFALTAISGGAQPSSSIPQLPKEELFVQQPGLAVSLVPKAATLRGGDDPGFKVRFENHGQRTLYLVPHVEPNLYISTADGEPVAPAISGIAERVAITVTRDQLIRLEPGRSWDAPVAAGFHEEDVTRSHMYVRWGMEKGSGSGLLLSPGEYIARFAYINAPGYAASYDPSDMPSGIWEGRVETAPVRFTVVAPASSQLESDLKRLGRSADPMTAAQVRAYVLPAADVIEEFKVNPGSRRSILYAARARPAGVSRQLLEVMAALPATERLQIILSVESSRLLASRGDCSALALLTNELDTSRGDVLTSLRPAFDRTAVKCPEIRARLRALVAGEPGDPSLYARGNAAALLGTFKNSEDVPLLVAALERRLPRIPLPTPATGDPIGRGAVTGLALIGGPAVIDAIGGVLGDNRRNHWLGAEIVERIGEILGADAAQPLERALGATNVSVLNAAVTRLGQLRATSAATRLRELAGHPNALIRAAAMRALRAIGDAGVAGLMRAAANDPDESVQANALFYLGERGDATDLDLFVRRLESRHQYVREAAVAGVARFGRADTFPAVRKLLDVKHGGIHASVRNALRRLTFVDRAEPSDWDAWHRTNRGKSRSDWAREAVERSVQASGDIHRLQSLSVSSVSYLAETDAPASRSVFERAAAARSAPLRIEAAGAIARLDRRYAIALLVREFDGRYVTACAMANTALNSLGRSRHVVDCTNPADREHAQQYWRTRAD